MRSHRQGVLHGLLNYENADWGALLHFAKLVAMALQMSVGQSDAMVVDDDDIDAL